MTDLTWATSGTISGLANNQQGNVIADKLAKMLPSATAPTTVSTGLASIAGLWWHDTTNGQIKVRDQADTTWVLIGTIDETNKLFSTAASGIATVQGACKNLKLDTRTGVAVVTVDELVVETTGNSYGVVRGVSVTISTATTGANGLDTGTVTPNTWYAVWIITNGTTVAGLLSTSATAPTMPSGYTYKARVGWVRTNATPVLYPTLQSGRTASYVLDGVVLTQLRQMASGNTNDVLTAASVSSFVPSTAGRINVMVFMSTGTSVSIGVAPNGNYDTDFAPLHLYVDANNQAISVTGLITLESSNVYWFSNNGIGYLRCVGWEDNL